MFPIYLLTFTGIIAFYVIDFFSLSLSLFFLFSSYNSHNILYVFMHAFFFHFGTIAKIEWYTII